MTGSYCERNMSMLPEVQVADATSEEIGVFGPDRTVESKGRCQNRPVLRIACAEALPRFGFELTVQIPQWWRVRPLPSKPLPDRLHA